MAVGCWHTTLFICHAVALLLCFSLGVYLVIKQNMVYSSLMAIKSVRDDPMIRPSEDSVEEENNPAEVATRSIRQCLLVCGAIALLLSFFIFVNLYCFLAVILAPDSAALKTLPGLQMIRERMEVEVATTGIQDEQEAKGKAPPPGAAGEGSEGMEGSGEEPGEGEEGMESMSSPGEEGGESAKSEEEEGGESAKNP